MQKQLQEINHLNQQNERRKFYKSVKIMKRVFQPRTSGCKSIDGKMIAEEGKVLVRWIEYFTEMLNEEEKYKEDYRRSLILRLDHVLEQPQEICK
jgi:hypothetical protein